MPALGNMLGGSGSGSSGPLGGIIGKVLPTISGMFGGGGTGSQSGNSGALGNFSNTISNVLSNFNSEKS